MTIKFSYFYGKNFSINAGSGGGFVVKEGIFRVTISPAVEIVGTLTITANSEIIIEPGATLLVSSIT